jgi:hypothetical protein
MKQRIVSSVQYECEVCGTEYDSLQKATECEAMPVEQRWLKKGAFVQNLEPRSCGGDPYRFTGKVTKVIGPKPFDYEYETKWLGSRGLNTHVFEYRVSYKCPICGEKKGAQYYAPELKRVGKPKKVKTSATRKG